MKGKQIFNSALCVEAGNPVLPYLTTFYLVSLIVLSTSFSLKQNQRFSVGFAFDFF